MYQWIKITMVSHFLQEAICAWDTFWTTLKIDKIIWMVSEIFKTRTRIHMHTHMQVLGTKKKVRSAVNYTSMKAMVITITNIIRLINTKRRKVITRVIIWYCLLMSFPPKKSHRACYITGQCGTSLKQNKRNLKKPNP